MQSATEAGYLSWLGFMRSEEALIRVSGSLAAVCLLRNLPNYRVSLSTKIVEYGALVVPVITTPLPLGVDLVRSENVGIEVPWNDPSAVVDAILKLRAEPELRRQMGTNGHKVALREYDWNRLSADFVRVMGRVAGRRPHRCSLAEGEALDGRDVRSNSWRGAPATIEDSFVVFLWNQPCRALNEHVEAHCDPGARFRPPSGHHCLDRVDRRDVI